MQKSTYDDLIAMGYKLEKAAMLIHGQDNIGKLILLINKDRIDNFIQRYIEWYAQASNILLEKDSLQFKSIYEGRGYSYAMKDFLLNYATKNGHGKWKFPASQFVKSLKEQRMILIKSREQTIARRESVVTVVHNILNINPIKIFDIQPIIKDDKLCFVIMPFANELQEMYEECIKVVIEEEGLKCIRGDDIFQSGPIISQIWHQIMKARIVIADLTKTNGNVMYELGLAHVVGHEAILLAQNMEDVPFDLRHQRVIIYTLNVSYG